LEIELGSSEKSMLGIILMVAVQLVAFAALWGLLHFTAQVIQRPRNLANSRESGAPAPTPARPHPFR
jgi:hypothetical protein